MTLSDILQDIHALNEDLETFERKYGVLSETFYEFYMKGEEPERQEWVLDFADWAGSYKIWLRRQQQYREAVRALQTQGVAPMSRGCRANEFLRRAWVSPSPICLSLSRRLKNG